MVAELAMQLGIQRSTHHLRDASAWRDAMSNASHPIGSKVFHNGTEITITTEPYEKYGGQFQDGTDSTGKARCVVAPAQAAANVARDHRDRAEMQAGFSRLRK